MKALITTIISIILIINCSGSSRKSDQDLPFKHGEFASGNSKKIKTFLLLIKPYVKMSMKSYPEIKKRFKKGLPKGHRLFALGAISDKKGGYELVYIKVKEISYGKTFGTISSNVRLVKSQKKGDSITLKDTQIMDWIIIKNNGAEEGGYLTLFLEARRDRYIAVILKISINKKGRVTSAQFFKAINKKKRDISFILSDEMKRSVEKESMKKKYRKTKKTRSRYVHFIYDMLKNKTLNLS